MGIVGALVVFGIIGLIFAVSRRSSDDQYAIAGRVVDTPTAGQLDAAEAAGFRKICDEVTELTLELLAGFEEVAELLEEDRGVEAAERFSSLDEALEQLPEVAAQGEEFEGGSVEPKWWTEHVRELAERLTTVDDAGKIASAEGGMSARGAAEAGTRLLAEIALSSDDFARRMLGFDLESQVRQSKGKASARALRAAIDEAQERMG